MTEEDKLKQLIEKLRWEAINGRFSYESKFGSEETFYGGARMGGKYHQQEQQRETFIHPSDNTIIGRIKTGVSELQKRGLKVGFVYLHPSAYDDLQKETGFPLVVVCGLPLFVKPWVDPVKIHMSPTRIED